MVLPASSSAAAASSPSSGYLLFQSSSGYSLLHAHGIDEIGQNTEALRNSVTDLNRFGKVVQLVAFDPLVSAVDALNQANAVSEEIELFFYSNRPAPDGVILVEDLGDGEDQGTRAWGVVVQRTGPGNEDGGKGILSSLNNNNNPRSVF